MNYDACFFFADDGVGVGLSNTPKYFPLVISLASCTPSE